MVILEGMLLKMYDWMLWIALPCIALSVIMLNILSNLLKHGSLEENAKRIKILLSYLIVSILLMFVGIVLSTSHAVLNKQFMLTCVGFGMGITFSTTLIRSFSIHKAIMAFIVKKVPFFSVEANDVIARLLMEKNNKNLIIYSSLFLSLVAEYVIYRTMPEFSMLIAMAITIALLALNFANQQILYYRLKCGLYGSCASEAREIIAYIIEQMKDKDSSGGLPKLVFKEEELAERVLGTDGGEECAG